MNTVLLQSISRLVHVLPILAFVFVFCVLVLPQWGERFAARQRPRLNRWCAQAMPHARRIVYGFATLWASALLIFAALRYPTFQTSLPPLLRLYALTALFLLFAVLVPGLFRAFLPRLPLTAVFIRARRAIGVSAFFFSFLHATLAFFVQLGGSIFAVAYLAQPQQTAIALSASAMLVLTALAITSFDRLVSKIGPQQWKRLHRLVYPAIIFLLFHAFLIGSHFANPRAALPVIVSATAMALLVLEASATIVKLLPRRTSMPRMKWYGAWILLILTILLGCGIGLYALSHAGFDPHGQHPRITSG